VGGTATAVVSYAYSPKGKIVEHGPRKFGYDARGRLTMSAIGDGAASGITKYAHNTLGQRVVKTEPLFPPAEPQEQSWWDKILGFLGMVGAPIGAVRALGMGLVYDEQGTLLAEIGMGGPASTGSTEYIWLPTPSGQMPVAAVINGSVYAAHAEHLNTPRRLTDGNGAVVWQWKFDAFGEEQPTIAGNGFVPAAAQPGNLTFNLRYPGQYADAESGLNYNYFRSYDAGGGRYTQPDPIGLDGGWNRFAYVEGNPLARVDPTGHGTCYYSVSSGQMTCRSDQPGSSHTFSGDFASGNNSIPGCKNNSACESIPNAGPIPTGVWRWDANGNTAKPGGRVLDPIAVDTTRSLFRTHSCANPFGPSVKAPFCSEGCVTGTPSTISDLNRFLDGEAAVGIPNILIVIP
jgi:RHS repeat-associated protein